MVAGPVANSRANTMPTAPRWKRRGVRRPAPTAIIYYKASSSSGNSSSSAAVSQNKSCHGNATTSMPTNNQTKMRPITRKDIAVWLSRVLGSISGLVFGILTIWYTIRAWADGHCSAMLAQWTSQKDFWEFCSDVCLISLYSSTSLSFFLVLFDLFFIWQARSGPLWQ